MRKKLLFLAVTVAMCGTPLLSSCSKDDEPQQTVQNVSVANTVWRADDGTTFKFYADGTCILGSNTLYDYRQVGNEVNIYHNCGWYGEQIVLDSVRLR